jgi:glycosyltransferase involved in cell wall biosynthesis
MISVFTPSHNTQWLSECYKSLASQTHTDWEWIVLLNGGVGEEDVEWYDKSDSRVRVFFSDTEPVIGALKNEAVSLCEGDILLEFDHDDILMPTALEEVQSAFDSDPEIGFVYSDFAEIDEQGNPSKREFNTAYGWTYHDDENGYHVCEGKSPHPHHVAYIWYAPNHLRAFRASAYDEIGGYNKTLRICDDADLMVRFYKKTKFYHIQKNLYLQRLHGQQSQAQQELNDEIQRLTVSIYDKNIMDMMVKWSNDNGFLALDLGGAHNPAKGFKTVDLHEPADIVGDIFNVLGDMEDDSVGVIRACDFLEHIPDKIRLWNEMYRVLAPGGMILSLTPSTDGRGAFQDPTHCAFYNENSFWYWIDENYRKYVPEIKTDFQKSRFMTFFPSPWHEENQIPYVCANLIAIKNGERYGGLLGI